MALRLAFMGSAEFSVPTLAALIDAGHVVAAVYTRPAKPAGRGHHPKSSPVETFARERGLAVLTPKTLRSGEAEARFSALALDAAVVAAYGLILPPGILSAPRFGCLNVHASLLPRWRGAAPIQRAILAGDAETGITIMQMDAGLDTGPILKQAALPIGPGTTAEDLHDRLAALGARLIADTLEDVAAGTLLPHPQPAEGATYARKLERDEGRLDFRRPAAELERAVRALNPWPGVWFEARGERIKVLAAEVAAGHGDSGSVLDDELTVACGDGALRLLTVQRGGRSPMTASAMLRGFPLPPGSRVH